MDEKTNHHTKNLDNQALFRYSLVSEVLAYESMGAARPEAVETVADTDHQGECGVARRVSSRTMPDTR